MSVILIFITKGEDYGFESRWRHHIPQYSNGQRESAQNRYSEGSNPFQGTQRLFSNTYKNEPFFRGLGSTPALNSRRSANNSLVLMWDWYNGYYSCLPEHISLLCVEEAGDGSSILLSHTKGSCYVHYGVSTGSGSFLYQQCLTRLFTMRTTLGL